ncbi:YceD family protein [Egicoccus halophilus]|uniref:Metal-binding protein n=1 Tax=Egicoccus halophilus TaxID=1670830 RepID=A0A8J3AAH3_9ACTN|nr:DUF177 domain-containing protein [Egicoccus halophilus]GGI06452.1 metal-binding protein [Egicoccus halophilus]
MRVPVIELVDHPGATRALSHAAAVEEFGEESWGAADGAIRSDIDLDLHLDAVVDGILVRGRVGADLELPCSRCLVDQAVRVDSDVAELFVDPAKREEDDEEDPGYELIDDRTAIDLSVMVRDALLIDLPLRVLCREDCQGLCEECGTDRNQRDCGHRPDEAPDPRWAALADLDLPNE